MDGDTRKGPGRRPPLSQRREDGRCPRDKVELLLLKTLKGFTVFGKPFL